MIYFYLLFINYFRRPDKVNFDLIILPSHDSLKLKKLNNVVSTLGTLVKKQ